LFDLKAHFFVPTRNIQTLSRAGAVKVGRRSDISSCSDAARPHLDSSEHGSTLVVIGMTRSRGARLWRTNIRAATLYSVGRKDPDHDAVLRIGSESSEAAGPFCTTAWKPWFSRDPATSNRHRRSLTVVRIDPKPSGYWRRILN